MDRYVRCAVHTTLSNNVTKLEYSLPLPCLSTTIPPLNQVMISSSRYLAMFFSQYTRNKHENSHTLCNNIKLNLLLRLPLLLVRLANLVQRQGTVFTALTRTNSHSVAKRDEWSRRYASTARESHPPNFYSHVRAHVIPVNGVAKIKVIINSI
jgi:hypothetical protein